MKVINGTKEEFVDREEKIKYRSLGNLSMYTKVKVGGGHTAGRGSSWVVEEQKETDTRGARSKIHTGGQQWLMF